MKNRPHPEPRPRKWVFPGLPFIIAVVALAGVGAFMYPMTAAWWSQYYQSKVVTTYMDEVQEDPPPGNEIAIGQAHQYNELLDSGHFTVGQDARIPQTNTERADLIEVDGKDYWDLLKTQYGTMARLRIPSIDVDLPVYHGTSEAVLQKGVGHLQGTSLPVGGSNTHSVLSAHTGLSTATMFNNLEKMELGDTFTVEVFGEVLTYEAIETQVVLPHQTEAIQLRRDEDVMTLVTCTPLGINTHRYLVTGKRVFPTPLADIEAAQETPDIPRFPWWAVILSSSVALAGIYVYWEGKRSARIAASKTK